MENTKRLRNTFGWSANAAKVAEEAFGQILPDTALNELQINDAGYAVEPDGEHEQHDPLEGNFGKALSHGEHSGYDYEDRELLHRHGGDTAMHPMPDAVLERIENTIELNSVNGNDEENRELKALLRNLRAESNQYKATYASAKEKVQDLMAELRTLTPEPEVLTILLHKGATPEGEVGAIFRSSETMEHPEKMLGRALTGIAYKNLAFKSDDRAAHIFTQLVIDALREARQMGAPDLDLDMLDAALRKRQSDTTTDDVD